MRDPGNVSSFSPAPVKTSSNLLPRGGIPAERPSLRLYLYTPADDGSEHKLRDRFGYRFDPDENCKRCTEPELSFREHSGRTS